MNPTVPSPDPSDVAALQQSMYETIHRFTINVGGISRYMLERAAGTRPAQLSWNTGIDYKVFFENGNARHTEAVRKLYQEAGLDLEADLETINAFARIAADSEALEYWGAPGRTVTGNPKIPVLRIHDVDDHLVPVSMVQAYDALVRKNGKEALYRTAFTKAPTHCGFTLAESAAAIETMTRRLDTGRWGSTEPEQLNELARSTRVARPASLPSTATRSSITTERGFRSEAGRAQPTHASE